MERKLTCIICPLGCEITVQVKDKKVISIMGNTCPRGKVYAETECVAPMRTITTTVKCKNGEMLPVKTSTPIPKEKMAEAMEIINKANPDLPISVGDVIIEEVFGSQIVAAKNLA